MASAAAIMAAPVVGVCSKAVKGRRRKMEDRSAIVHNLSTVTERTLPDRYGFYGVFDGHVGPEAAVFCAERLPRLLAESPLLPDKPHLALVDAIAAADQQFAGTGSKAGCAAVMALVSSSHLYIAWIGDCQAVLCRDGLPVRVVNPHKPERPDERARIEAQGGFVVMFGSYRVNGILSVSRAIGDGEFRPYVSDRPDVTTVPLVGTEEYLLLACDGFWDVVTSEQCIRLVADDLVQYPDDFAGLAGRLVQTCLARDSSDNISVVVVRLRPPPAADQPDGHAGAAVITSTDPEVASGRRSPPPDASESLDISRLDFDSPLQGQVTPDEFNLSAMSAMAGPTPASAAEASPAEFDIQREVTRLLAGSLAAGERADTPSPTTQTLDCVLSEIDGLREADSDAVEDDDSSSDDGFSYVHSEEASPPKQVSVSASDGVSTPADAAAMELDPFGVEHLTTTNGDNSGAIGPHDSPLNPAAAEFTPICSAPATAPAPAAAPAGDDTLGDSPLNPTAAEFVPLSDVPAPSPAADSTSTLPTAAVGQNSSPDMFAQLSDGLSAAVHQFNESLTMAGESGEGGTDQQEDGGGAGLLAQLGDGVASFVHQLHEQAEAETDDAAACSDVSSSSVVVGNAKETAAGDAEEPAAGDAKEPAAGDAKEPAAGDVEEPAAGDVEEPAAGNAEEPAAGGEVQAGGDLFSQLSGGLSSLAQQLQDGASQVTSGTSVDVTAKAEGGDGQHDDDQGGGLLAQIGAGVSSLVHQIQESAQTDVQPQDVLADESEQAASEAAAGHGGVDLLSQFGAGVAAFVEQMQENTDQKSEPATAHSPVDAPADAVHEPGADEGGGMLSQLSDGVGSFLQQIQENVVSAGGGDSSAAAEPSAVLSDDSLGAQQESGGDLFGQLSDGVSAFLQDKLAASTIQPSTDPSSEPSSTTTSAPLPEPDTTAGDGLFAQLSESVSMFAHQVQENITSAAAAGSVADEEKDDVRAQIDSTTDSIFSALSSAVQGSFGGSASPEAAAKEQVVDAVEDVAEPAGDVTKGTDELVDASMDGTLDAIAVLDVTMPAESNKAGEASDETTEAAADAAGVAAATATVATTAAAATAAIAVAGEPLPSAESKSKSVPGRTKAATTASKAKPAAAMAPGKTARAATATRAATKTGVAPARPAAKLASAPVGPARPAAKSAATNVAAASVSKAGAAKTAPTVRKSPTKPEERRRSGLMGRTTSASASASARPGAAADAAPSATKSTASAAAKPAAARPAAARPAAARPIPAKLDAAKSTSSKPAAAKPTTSKPATNKLCAARPTTTRPATAPAARASATGTGCKPAAGSGAARSGTAAAGRSGATRPAAGRPATAAGTVNGTRHGKEASSRGVTAPLATRAAAGRTLTAAGSGTAGGVKASAAAGAKSSVAGRPSLGGGRKPAPTKTPLAAKSPSARKTAAATAAVAAQEASGPVGGSPTRKLETLECRLPVEAADKLATEVPAGDGGDDEKHKCDQNSLDGGGDAPANGAPAENGGAVDVPAM